MSAVTTLRTLSLAALLVGGSLLTTTANAAPVHTCDGLPATIVGTDHADTIYGTPADDVVWLGAGNDIFIGQGGHDVVCGGPGDDGLSSGTSQTVLFGGSGNDTLAGGPGDELHGGSGHDTIGLIGNKAADAPTIRAYGGGGVDFIQVRDANAVVWGDGGADVISVKRSRASVHGGAGNDAIWLEGPATGSAGGGAGVDTLMGALAPAGLKVDLAKGTATLKGATIGVAGFEVVVGSKHADVLAGGGHDDYLFGARGDDVLRGRGGSDHLSGGRGDDTLYGGAGVDYLDGNRGVDHAHGGAGTDYCKAEHTVGC